MAKQNITEMPAVNLYSVGPDEIGRVSSFFTPDAVSFIRNGDAFGAVISEDNTIKGGICARYSIEDPTRLDIISLCVSPDSRREGLGITLLLEAGELLFEESHGEITKVSVLFPSDMEDVKGLLQKVGFLFFETEGTTLFRTEIGKLRENAILSKKAPPGDGATLRPLSALSDGDIRTLITRLRADMVDYVSPEEIKSAISDASFVLCDKSGAMSACAIFTLSGNTVTLAQFYTNGANSAITVLQSGAAALAEKFPPETILEIPTIEESAASLVKKILPDCTPVGITHALLPLFEAEEEEE